MSHNLNFKTPHESFWAGDFGDRYTDRNDGVEIARSNLMFWGNILRRVGSISSCLELGCNRGLNLDAIRTLLPGCQTNGIEINSYAASEGMSKGHHIYEGSILSPPAKIINSNDTFDLSFISGVLIHTDPDSLETVYDLLHSTASKYILISEYFNPVPVTVTYRGHNNRLYKRDFAREFWSKFPSLNLVDYGFVWSQDPVAPKDDLTWFIFGKQ